MHLLEVNNNRARWAFPGSEFHRCGATMENVPFLVTTSLTLVSGGIQRILAVQVHRGRWSFKYLGPSPYGVL